MKKIAHDDLVSIEASLRRLLDRQCDSLAVRKAMTERDNKLADIYRPLVELGISGLTISPDDGGVGGDATDLLSIMTVAGGYLLPAPFLWPSFLAAALLGKCGDASFRRDRCSAMASGERIITVALTGDAGSWVPTDTAVSARRLGDKWLLTGVASFVPFAKQADSILVVARIDDTIGVFAADVTLDFEIEPLNTWDPLLDLGRIEFRDVPATLLAGVNVAEIEQALLLGCVALAGEQIGAARRVLDMTVDYIRTRVQFGRPVGGFQALKHMATDMLLEMESAVSAASAAAKALSIGSADARQLVSLAAFTCSDAFSLISANAIQMHGGIGFTWEHDAHLYLRRARATAHMLGGPDHHREQYLRELEREDA